MTVSLVLLVNTPRVNQVQNMNSFYQAILVEYKFPSRKVLRAYQPQNGVVVQERIDRIRKRESFQRQSVIQGALIFVINGSDVVI